MHNMTCHIPGAYGLLHIYKATLNVKQDYNVIRTQYIYHNDTDYTTEQAFHHNEDCSRIIIMKWIFRKLEQKARKLQSANYYLVVPKCCFLCA